MTTRYKVETYKIKIKLYVWLNWNVWIARHKNGKHENKKRCCHKSQVNKSQVMIQKQKYETKQNLYIQSAD